jgi:hypothetical protein
MSVHAQVEEQDNRLNWLLDSSQRTGSGCFSWLSTAAAVKTPRIYPVIGTPVSSKTPLLSIHGDISYDFQYRSFVDTPYYQKDFSQHNIQANLNIVYRNQYPMRVVIRQRFNNSPYFRDMFDVNAQFNERMITTRAKQLLLEQADNWMHQRLNGLYTKADSLKKVYEEYKKSLAALEASVSNETKFGELVKAKEGFVERQMNLLAKEKQQKGQPVPETETLKQEVMLRYDSILRKGLSVWSLDSINNPTLSKLQEKQQVLEQKQQELRSQEQRIRQTERSITDSIATLKKQVNQLRDGTMLKEYIGQNKDLDKHLPKGWRLLTSVKNIGIGRSWVDYSELTIKNISLTGAHIEVNPGKIYVAAGVGRINARFRDFVLSPQGNQPKQGVHFFRVGVGSKEKNNLILTYYNGRRSLLNFMSDTSNTVTAALQRVMGISLENHIRIDRNNELTIELARSSFVPTAGNANKDAGFQQIFNVGNRSNEAYSVKLNSHWPQTQTTVSGFYRKMGEHFQSFNLQPVNTEQESYAIKIKQLLWRQKLQLEAGIRKNDFSSPYVNPGLQSKTVFKSIMASLRVPKYPVVTVGFYPSSQLTLLDNNVLVENQYNTLTGIVSYGYRVQKTAMTSNLSYLKFYNKAADTSFIYYNATNWSLNHTIFHQKLQLQSGLSYAAQSGLKITTIEQSAGYQLKNWLYIQGGVKYNRVDMAKTLWGSSGALTINIQKIGRVQFQYERSYLPGMDRNLLPMDMGRFNFYRSF